VKRIYFSIPVKSGPEEGAREVVSAGSWDIGPQGMRSVIFFGRTPASRGDEIRAASAVNIIGKVLGDPRSFRKVRDGVKIRLEKA